MRVGGYWGLRNFPSRPICAFAMVMSVLLLGPGMAIPQVQAQPTAEDLKIIRQRVLQTLAGRSDDREVRSLLTTQQEDGSWKDVDYRDGNGAVWKTHEHLVRLLFLAQSFRLPESEFFKSPELRMGILDGLNFWLFNDFKNKNWWWNVIGVPRHLFKVMLLMEDELSSPQLMGGIEILKRGQLGMTGQNLVWVAEITAMRGLLEKDAALIGQAFQRIQDEIFISDKEGIKRDFSFHQHGDLLYSHGYGAGFVIDCSRMANITAGTGFAFTKEKTDLLMNLVLDGHRWLMRGGMCDYGAAGREITRRGKSASYMKTVVETLSRTEAERKDEFGAFMASIQEDFSQSIVGNRHFWCSDIMTHHREKFYASARMFSNRLLNTDGPANREGLLSHHLSDGCTYIMRRGDEYRDIFPVWDWQKIPGTTIEQMEKMDDPVCIRGSLPFAGGASDGMYGVAAFDFRRENLTARKAWFFFDDEFVSLGAGINSDSDNPVFTTINQCLMHGDVHIRHNGLNEALPEGSHALNNAEWIYHDSIAYVPISPATVTLTNREQLGDWRRINESLSKETISRKVFTLFYDHGGNPRNQSYAYTVVPGIALKQVPEYIENSAIRIVRNDPGIQAVINDALDIAGIIFYESGLVELSGNCTIAVDNSCILLFRRDDRRLNVTVSNPKNQKADIIVSVRMTIDQNEFMTDIPFALPDGRDAGKSMTKTVTIN